MTKESIKVEEGIRQFILEFDEIEKKLNIAIKDLEENIIPNYKPSAEWAIVMLSSQWIQMIATICYYEKTLLFNYIYMYDNQSFDDSGYRLHRLQIQKQRIEDNINQIQQGNEMIRDKTAQDNNAMHNIENAISIATSSLSLFDRIIEIYNIIEKNKHDDGKKYSGQFKSGDINGQGIYILPDGEIYLGECNKSVPCGYGKVIYPDGSKYEGEIRNNIYEGRGNIVFPDGTNYIGQFENDMFSGKGEFFSPDGIKYIGEFQQNTFNGEGTFTLPDGNEFSGTWKDGTLIRQKVEKGAYLHPESGIIFPDSLADMERSDIINYELTQPGMGISVGYTANKVRATIYIYNLCTSNIPDEINSDLIKRHFNEVIKDIFEAYENGTYDAAIKLSEGKTNLGVSSKSREILSASLMLSQYGEKRISHIFLGVYNKNFFKVRFSYNESIKIEGDKALKLFLNEIEKLLNDKMVTT